MLIGIFSLISPELPSNLYRPGHDDGIVLSDAHVTGETYGQRMLRVGVLKLPSLLDAILPLFILDSYIVEKLLIIEAASGSQLDLQWKTLIEKLFSGVGLIPSRNFASIALIFMIGPNKLLLYS